MDIRDKLKWFEPAARSEPRPSRTDKSLIGRWIAGRELSNDAGFCFQASHRQPFAESHGAFQFSHVDKIDPAGFAIVGKDESFVEFDPKRAVFLDTETTGLTGGTGTFAFLVGLGRFEDGGFAVEQFFMRDLDEERALLTEISKRIGPADYLVTYNGKCYDLNLLSYRFTLARMPNPFTDVKHLDILFPVRRLWKRRIGDCSLSNAERTILGFKRGKDVPGWLIPGLYFDYIRQGRVQPMADVFRHNRWDILSLAGLWAKIGLIFTEPRDQIKHGQDWRGVAGIYEEADRLDEAVRSFRNALAAETRETDRIDILESLGRIYKHKRNWTDAVEVWEEAVRTGPWRLEPYEEIAKVYEHRLGDLELALEIVSRAVTRIEIARELNPSSRLRDERVLLEHRLNRLRRKTGRDG
jgi:uncharacterized protein